MKKNAAVANVRVSLNEGMTVLELKPGNTATLAELRRIIKNNGFVSKEVTATARGTVAADRTEADADPPVGPAWCIIA